MAEGSTGETRRDGKEKKREQREETVEVRSHAGPGHSTEETFDQFSITLYESNN